MARLFPLRSDAPQREGQPRVVDLEDEDADAVFGALSSATARHIYATLDDDPGTPSDVADAIDSSIQNVRYHLEKLEDAGLIEVVDTWYSSRGNEMSVYATADGPLIVTSDRSTAEKLKVALSRFVGGVAALAGGSLLVQYGLERFVSSGGYGGADGGGEGTSTESEDDAAVDGESGVGIESGGDGGADDSAQTGAGADADAADSTGGGGNYSAGTDADADADGGSAADPDPDPDPDWFVFDGSETADGGTEVAEAIVSTIPPGMLFFLGGLVVLVSVTAYWYWRTY